MSNDEIAKACADMRAQGFPWSASVCESLQAENARLLGVVGEQQRIRDQQRAENARLTSEVARLRDDAERYQWLRDNCVRLMPHDRDGPQYMQVEWSWNDWPKPERTLDAAIDAVLAKFAKPCS